MNLWVSVADRMPSYIDVEGYDGPSEVSHNVLVLIEPYDGGDRWIYIDFRLNGKWAISEKYGRVTHWMPLPEINV